MVKSGNTHQICNGTNVPLNPDNMECHSRKFLTQLQHSITDYDYVLLDFLPVHIRKRHAHYHLDMLVNKGHYNDLLLVLSGAESLNFIRTRMSNHAQEIELVFNDLSQLSLTLRTNLYFRNLLCGNESEIISNHRIENGFKVPSLANTFEYHLLKSLSGKNDFPHAYCVYFSHCTFEERSSVFASIVPKYKFVINVLDELMHYKSRNRRLVKKSIERMKPNKGIRLFYRLITLFSTWVKTLLFGRWNYYYQSGSAQSVHTRIGDFLSRKAYLRAG